MPRRRDSVRFDPYYKVQWFDERNHAWRDEQKMHDTPMDARAAYLPGKRCRVMKITEAGRTPLED